MVVTGASSTSDVAVVGSPAPLKTRGRNAISENALRLRRSVASLSAPPQEWSQISLDDLRDCQEALYIGRPHVAARVM